jgi:hypothetical protein
MVKEFFQLADLSIPPKTPQIPALSCAYLREYLDIGILSKK